MSLITRAAEKVRVVNLQPERAPSTRPYLIAVVYVGLGDKDQVFAWLEKAREDQSEWMSWINTDARMDPLRADPRFTELRRRIGL